MSRFPEYSYENTRRVVYDGGATFVPVCERCYRIVLVYIELCLGLYYSYLREFNYKKILEV